MTQSDHIVEIIIQTNDQTGGALGKVQNSLLALDKVVQKTHDRLKRAFSNAYSATIRLIDQVTPAGSRVNDFLKRLAGKTYQLAMRLNDGVTNSIRNLEAKLMRLAGKTYTVAVNLKDNATQKVKGIADGALMGMGGMGVTMLGTAGIGYGAVSAVRSQMDFEKQMSAVKAIMSGSVSSPEELNAQMAQLTERAEEMGATTKFTAKEAAEGLYFMGMAGWTAAQQIAGLPSVLNLAAAGNTDLATTSDIVTDTLTAFGLKAGKEFEYGGKYLETSKHYTDMMAALVTNANTDISKLGQTLKYAAPVVQAMYANGTDKDKMQGAEDAMLITGLMANAGIKDTQAGTSLKAMLARLSGDQRNAYFAQNALGIDFVDQQTGEIRRLKDVVGDFRKAFKEGVDMNKVTDFFEQISGEKIHADTRRKLDSYFETAQKNGGKLTGKEMMKMTTLLSGLEAMPGWIATFLSSEEDWDKIGTALQNCEGAAERMSKIQLDNLAGDITLLGSAWDAFQRSFVKGKASEGLRDFVQALTDMVTKANNLFSDGIQIGDFGKIIADVLTRLKNKFLEFDGIGSILAGGALIAGLLKIKSTATGVYEKLKSLKNLQIGEKLGGTVPQVGRGSHGGIDATQRVNSMVVHANSVIVNGRTGNLGGKGGNQAYVDNYYKRRGEILAGQNPTSTTTAPTNKGFGTIAKSGLKVAGGAGALTLAFGAMDIVSTSSINDDRIAEAQAGYDKINEEYQKIVNNPERQAELPQATENLNQAAADLKTVQKDAIKYKNESLFATGGAVAGAAAGAAIGSVVPVAGTLVGMILGAGLGYVGSEFDKELSHNFDFDVLGWLTGKNDKTSAAEKNIPQADWKMDDGRMYSELSARERIAHVDSATEIARREAAQVQHDTQVAQAKAAEFETESAKRQTEVFNRHKKDASPEEIAAKTAQFEKEDRQKRTDGTSLADDYSKNFQALNDNTKFAVETQKSGREAFWKNVNDFFSDIGKNVQNENAVKIKAMTPENPVTAVDVGNSGVNPITGQTTITPPTNIWTDFKMPELNIGAKIQNEIDFVSNTVREKIENLKNDFSQAWTDFNISDYLPDFSLSEWFSEKTSEIEVPDFSQMWTDFDISEYLPEFNISEWFSEKFSEVEMPDISSMLPEFNFSEWLSTMEMPDIATLLPDFSTITEPASTAFNSISTSATEAWTSLQTSWNELPGFFEGIFGGLGGIATTAGSAIASGINSGIGMIKSAWGELSGWLSEKISSLSKMASNAANAVTSFVGGGGNVSPKAEGGFITSPQHILAGEAGTEVIIPLASSRRTRAMDLLKKTAAILGGDKINITGDTFKSTEKISEITFSESKLNPQLDDLGNIKDFSGFSKNVITADDDLSVRHAKKDAQLKEFWANNSELGEGLSTEDGAVTSGNGNIDNLVGGVEVGGIQATFQFSGAENPQEVI